MWQLLKGLYAFWSLSKLYFLWVLSFWERCIKHAYRNPQEFFCNITVMAVFLKFQIYIRVHIRTDRWKKVFLKGHCNNCEKVYLSNGLTAYSHWKWTGSTNMWKWAVKPGPSSRGAMHNCWHRRLFTLTSNQGSGHFCICL